MTPLELMSWLEMCPVEGEALVKLENGDLECEEHGRFIVVDGRIVFELYVERSE